MAEKLWNMLKLLPSMPASRKNSLITGLARIDENTEELILSLYHLPDPGEFVNGKEATYYAWTFDWDAKEYNKIGELQRKNGLTFGFKKKLTISGDGVVITVEPKGREIREPGAVVLASNPELFYLDLHQPEPEARVIVEKQMEEPARVEIPREISQEEIPAGAAPVKEPVRPAIPEPVAQAQPEPPVKPTAQPVRETEPESKPLPKPQPRPVNPREVPEEAKEDPDQTAERLKKLFTDFYSELPGDEIFAMIKNRYQSLKDEVDLHEYWEKIKKFAHNLYYETKLHELWEEITKDLKYLADKLGLDDLWERIEKFVMEVIRYIDPKYWLHKIKGWLHEIDMYEWYEKGKKYINAILEEVNPVVLWSRIKEWLDNLLAQMNIDEIVVWIQVKFRQMRSMTWEQIKAEIIRLLKEFVEALKLPELKMAVIKVAIREKLGQVGNFFQKVKGNAEKPAGEPRSQEPSGNGKKMNPYFNQRNPENPANIYSNPRYPQTQPGAGSARRQSYQGSGYPQGYLYNNPYIFKPAAGYSESPTMYPGASYGYPYMQSMYTCPYMQSMCRGGSECPYAYSGANWNVGFDALGDPRYLYSEEDEGYYFITPDGEIISRS